MKHTRESQYGVEGIANHCFINHWPPWLCNNAIDRVCSSHIENQWNANLSRGEITCSRLRGEGLWQVHKPMRNGEFWGILWKEILWVGAAKWNAWKSMNRVISMSPLPTTPLGRTGAFLVVDPYLFGHFLTLWWLLFSAVLELGVSPSSFLWGALYKCPIYMHVWRSSQTVWCDAETDWWLKLRTSVCRLSLLKE